jgi:polar amino acid transport system substrate-binding protein
MRCLLSLLCLAALCLGGCSAESVSQEPGAGLQDLHAETRGRLDLIRERGRLVAGVRSGAPPFAFVDERTKELVGFEVDICRYIADSLGVDLELKPVSTATRIPAVVQGAVDLVAAMLTHRFSFEEFIDFSITYFMDGQKLLVAKASGISSVAELAGKKVATVRGSLAEQHLLSSQPKATILTFEGYAQALEALESGKVDGLSADSTLLLGLRNSASIENGYVVTGEFMTLEPFAIGLPENDSTFRDVINLALVQMWNSGEYERLYTKWFGPDTDHHLPSTWEMETWPM